MLTVNCFKLKLDYREIEKFVIAFTIDIKR